MASIRIGISGWRYPPWRGTFYPADLPQRAELEYASRILPVIEINGSFYSLQRPQDYSSWYAQTPADFMFTVKGPRFITHMKRLREVREALANFLASGVFNLADKLGPVLWQFPPSFVYDHARMQSFFELLPSDTDQARELARHCASWMKERSALPEGGRRVLRYAVEVRHESFLDAAFLDLLSAHHIALVITESARQWPMIHDVTSDFLYMRLHGDRELYRSGYSDRALDRWAARIRAWNAGLEPDDVRTVSARRPSAPTAEREVYCFFDNTDVKLRAPFDAQTLMRKLGLTPGTAPAINTADLPGVLRTRPTITGAAQTATGRRKKRSQAPGRSSERSPAPAKGASKGARPEGSAVRTRLPEGSQRSASRAKAARPARRPKPRSAGSPRV